MRILFLTRSFNSLTQRLYLELSERGHEVSVELDIARRGDDRGGGAVPAGAGGRALPQARDSRGGVAPAPCAWWCTRASSATAGRRRWTGPSPTASRTGASPCCRPRPRWTPARSGPPSPLPCATPAKSSLYRREVTDAAVRALLRAVQRFEAGAGPDRARGRRRRRPLAAADAPGRPAHRLAARRHARRAAQAARRRRRAGGAGRMLRRALPPVRRPRPRRWCTAIAPAR